MAQTPQKIKAPAAKRSVPLTRFQQEAKDRGVSPEALAAFYRQRSESLRGAHTVQGETTNAMIQAQKDADAAKAQPMGLFDYIISALKGTPGQR